MTSRVNQVSLVSLVLKVKKELLAPLDPKEALDLKVPLVTMEWMVQLATQDLKDLW